VVSSTEHQPRANAKPSHARAAPAAQSRAPSASSAGQTEGEARKSFARPQVVPDDGVPVPQSGFPFNRDEEPNFVDIDSILNSYRNAPNVILNPKHSLLPLLNGDEAKSVPQVRFLLSELFKVNKFVTTKLLQRVEWKIVVEFPQELFITPGKRWASRTERAYFNLLRNMNPNVWSEKRLSAKVTSDIGKVTRFFQNGGKLELTDIWARITRKVSGLQEIDKQINFLGGREL